jgi:hypothetical protein
VSPKSNLTYTGISVQSKISQLTNNYSLNWPTWRKDLILFIVGMSASVVGAYGPMLGPGFTVISKELGISVEVLSQSTAWLILTLGLCVFLMNPAAKIWGKRPIYVFASIVLFVVSIWGAVADTYGSFLGSRILGALGMAPYEVLVQATINDLYFVHLHPTFHQQDPKTDILTPPGPRTRHPHRSLEPLPPNRNLRRRFHQRLHHRRPGLQMDLRDLRHFIRGLRPRNSLFGPRNDLHTPLRHL